MKNIFRKIGVYLYMLPVLLLPTATYAQLTTSQSTLSDIGDASGLKSGGGGSLTNLVGRLIQTLLGVLGIVFVILIIYAGILYMTASGDDEKVKKAKSLMIQAVIGIIIIVAAYAIASFVIDALYTATSGTPAP